MTMPQTMNPRIMRSPAGLAAVRANAPQIAAPLQVPNQRPASRYDGPGGPGEFSPSGISPMQDATSTGYAPAQTSFLGGMKAAPGPVPAAHAVSRQGIGSSYDAGDGLGRFPGSAAGATPRGTPMQRPAYVAKSPLANEVLGGRYGGAQSFADLMRGATGRASGFRNEYLGPQSTAVSMAPTADQEVTGSEPTGSEPGGGSDSGFATTGAGLAAAEQQNDPSQSSDTGGQGVILGAGSMFDGGADIGGMHISDGLLVDHFGNTHGNANDPSSWDDLARAAAKKRGWSADAKIQEPGQMSSQDASSDTRTESGRTQAEDILREILGWDAPQMDQGALDAKIRADEAATAYQTGKGIQSAMSMGGRGRMGAGWMAGTSAGLAAQGGLQHQQTAANMRLQAQMQNFQAQRDFFDRQIQAIMAMAGYADSAVARQAVAQLQNQRIAADRSLAELQHQWSQEITPASIFGLLGNAGGQIGGALLGRWAFGGG